MSSAAIFKGRLVKFLAKAGILVPARPDGDRSAIPSAGEMAFNTDANKLEVYNGTAWDQLAAGGGGTGEIVLNPQTESYTLQATDNGSTIVMKNSSRATLTVPSGLASNFNCRVIRTDGLVKFTGSGATVNSKGSLIKPQHGAVEVQSYEADVYNVAGDIDFGGFGLIFNNSIYSTLISGNFAYVGGAFTSITDRSGVVYTRQFIAKINLTTGTVDPTFNSSSGFNSAVRSLQLSPDGNSLYVGGEFTAYVGTTRQYIAKLNASTALLDSTFNSSSGFNSTVRSIQLSLDGNSLYCGGDFSSYQGITDADNFCVLDSPDAGLI